MRTPASSSLSIQAPSSVPPVVEVTPNTCSDLSSFKDLLKEYRRLDDAVTMRMNRNQAQFRERERSGLKGDMHDQACKYFWKELVENWQRRSRIIHYCVNVVDQQMEEKRRQIVESDNTAAQRKIQGALYADEVKRRLVHNELYVDTTIRKRSLDVFRSRCRFFQPPLTDAEARKWWDDAQA